MIYLPIEKLKENMIVARDVNIHSSAKFGIPLIRCDVVLTKQHIEKLKQYYIQGIYIEKTGTENIIPDSPIDEKLKVRALVEIKKIFNTFQDAEKSISPKIIDGIEDISKYLVDSAIRDKNTLISLIELKSHDDYTYIHSLCVSILSIATGVAMGLNTKKLNELALASLLHDLGKVNIPKEIINKPAKLSETEFEIIKKHPISGRNLLEKRLHLVPHAVLSGIRSHHEKYDGTGYPKGIQGKLIHVYAKIIALADVYDALTSKRPYRDAVLPSEAIEYILGGANTHFDYEILKCFLKKIVAYPVGSIVQLSNGRKAIVAKNYSENILRPLVWVIDDDNEPKYIMDLLNDTTSYDITIIKEYCSGINKSNA